MKNEINKKSKDFLEYLEVDRGLSKRTVANYGFYLERFTKFAQENGVNNPNQITKELVHKYRLFLNRMGDENENDGLKKNTQNYHLIALRGLLKHMVKNDVKTLDPGKIELAKQDQRQVDFLDAQDMEKILKAPLMTDAPHLIQTRDKALLETLFSTGLRVSELAKLKKDEVNLNKEEFTVRGKGKKVRIVFLSEDARHWLKKYLEARQDINPYMFVSHDRANKNEEDGITSRSIERIVQRYAKLAGIMKKVTPHTLRHSYATDLLMNGADIRSVQAMLGHSSIITTQVYTHITDQQLREVHKAFHGTRRKKKTKD